MKKLLALLLALVMVLSLAACQSSSGPADDDDDDDERQEEEREGDGADQSDDREEDAVQDSGVPYEIVLVDNSVVNENGDILVRKTYEQVVLLSDDPACQAINALIQADCDAFLADNPYITVEDYEEQIEAGGYGYDAFRQTATATVVHNSNGLISIKIGADYFMGGVYNVNFYGFTYDLSTGEEAKLADVLDMPEEEALALVREVAAEGLTEYYGDALFGDPAEQLATYSLEHFLFFVDNGELVLAFSTYEFSYGAAGPATIYTGIYVG